MKEVNYYLKKPRKASDPSLIILKVMFSGRRLTCSTGRWIHSTDWSKKKQRSKRDNLAIISFDEKGNAILDQYTLNDVLDTVEKQTIRFYEEESNRLQGTPPSEAIKSRIKAFLNRHAPQAQDSQKTFYKLAERFINNEIAHEGGIKSKETLKKYQTTKNRLLDFEKETRFPINYETITLDFYNRYVAWMADKGMAKNTIAKDIQVIKVWMNEANDLGETTNLSHRHRKFKASWEESDAVYLNEAELDKLYRHDFSGKPRLDKIRDIFLFGCWSGFRFSDFKNLKPENFISHEGQPMIKVITQKTRQMVIVPCHGIILEVLKKYDNHPSGLPKAPSIQKFNDYIKEVCKEAGLTQKGRLAGQPGPELWECVSSHTARRSFATNLYLKKVSSIDIMKLTGHKTETSFLKYIKDSKLDAALNLAKHFKIKKEAQTLLKVV